MKKPKAKLQLYIRTYEDQTTITYVKVQRQESSAIETLFETTMIPRQTATVAALFEAYGIPVVREHTPNPEGPKGDGMPVAKRAA